MYVGDVVAGATVRGAFNTRDTDGAPITLAGTPLIRVYKDDGTTEDSDGITLNVDFDSRTGLHLWEIDTSADAVFYAAGADFLIVVTQGTVDSISVVGVCVGHFSIENRNIKADVTKISGDSGAADNLEAAADGTGYNLGGGSVVVASVSVGGIAASSFAAGAIDNAALAANAIGASELAADAIDEILDETIGDSTITMRQALRLTVAALAGKLSGAATTTVTIRNIADDTDRITATVDADGNRSAVTVSV